MSSLPSELWLIILREVVHVPFLFDAGWQCPPQIALWRGWKPLYTLEIGTTHKRQVIVQVSRQWRSLGMPLLYEYIAIYQDEYQEAVSRLCSTPEDSALAGTSSTGYGQWTKRLHLPMKAITPKLISTLIRILSACPNLRILAIGGVHGQRRRVEFEVEPFNQLITFLNDSQLPLLRLDIDFEDNGFPHGFVSHRNVPSSLPLASLDLPIIISQPHWLPTDAFESITTLSFDLLSTIDIIPSAWYFPALKHLSLHGISAIDIPALIPFMSKHGEKLESLATDHVLGCASLFELTPPLPSLTLRINSRFLRLSLAYIPRWLSSLTHVGIEIAPENGLPDVCIALAQFIKALPSSSRLQVIRFIKEVAPRYEEETEALESLIECCVDAGVRLEDENCLLLPG